MTKSQYQARIDKLQRIISKFRAQLDAKPRHRFERAVRLQKLSHELLYLQWEKFAYAKED